MAVSYLSKVYESNPYVLPVDLNLLAKVNSYKQGLFYQNANALKQQYSALKNSDILNPEQKAHLDEKYNNLTSQITNWGAVDYSDMGVINQMEGYANSIYADPIVLNGIASTKKVRTLMGNYEKMKTDPKLMKYYNKANEAWDMQDVNAYVSGGKESTYTGTTAPTVYAGNPYTIITQTLSKLKPNIEVHYNPVTNNPYYIEKTTSSILSPERVYAELDGKIDSNVLNQIKIDSWYNMQGMSEKQLEDIYTSNHNERIASYQDLHDKYKKDLDLAPNKETKVAIEAEMTKAKNNIAQENARYNVNNFRTQLSSKEGRIATQQDLYFNKLLGDAVKANSYQQVQSSLQVNIAQIQKDKFDLAMLQMKNARDIAAMRSGKKYKVDKDGNIVEVDASGAVSGLTDLTKNVQQLKELKEGEQLTVEKVNSNIAEKNNEIGTLLNKFFLDNAFKTDDQDRIDYLGLGGEDKFNHRLGQIALLDGKEGLSVQDVKSFLQKTTLKPNDKEKEYFQTVINSFESAANGDYKSINNRYFSASQFKSIYKAYADKQDAIEGFKYLLQDSKNKAFENYAAEKKLNATEKQYVTNFLANPSKFTTTKTETTASYPTPTTKTYNVFNGDNNMKAALSKAGLVSKSGAINESKKLISGEHSFDIDENITKNQKELLNSESYRQNYFAAYISDKTIDKYSDEVKSFVSDKIPGVLPENIKIIKIAQLPTTSENYKDTPWVLGVKYKEGDNAGEKDIPLTDDQASYFGVNKNTRMDLETTLLYKGQLTPRFVTNDAWGDAGVFKYQVVRPGGKNGTVQVVVKHGGETINVKNWVFNNAVEPFANGTQAAEVIENVIEQAHTIYPNAQDFIEELKKHSGK